MSTAMNKSPRPIDLALPKDKKPTPVADFSYRGPNTISQLVGAEYAIGSSDPDQQIYYEGQDLGLFAGVYEAWKNHWNLRTSPEDWWFPVACTVAKAIDKEAKKNEKVRQHFVNHEGKENICVDVDVFTIYEVNTEQFFSQIASQIKSRINVPEYAETMQNDFTTSTVTHRISSQINLMASMQQFFSFEMGMCGCGIKSVEMYGEQEDWDHLVTKLRELKKQLKPIMNELRWSLGSDWFDHVEIVFRKLAQTFASSEDGADNRQVGRCFKALLLHRGRARSICDFWADMFMVGDGWKYGPSGFGGHAAKEYNGWLVRFLTGRTEILEEDFFGGDNLERLKGLNKVPMVVTMKYKNPPVSGDSELVTGVMGFELFEETSNGVPSVQPHHMWAMTLPTGSPLRGQQ